MKVESTREVRITRVPCRGWFRRKPDLVTVEERGPGGEWNQLGMITSGGSWTVTHRTDIEFIGNGWNIVEPPKPGQSLPWKKI